MTKAKRRRRCTEPELIELVELHSLTLKRLTQLRHEYEVLLAAGKKTDAKDIQRRSERIEIVIRAIEAQVKERPDS